MPIYQGGCHCGAVRIEIDLPEPITSLLDCNCSVCAKKGILHHPADDAQFTLLRGADDLQLYQFRTNTARHWFCRHCGIHTHGRPRNNPSRYTINARCLDDFVELLPTVTMRYLDGINHPKDRAAADG
tara:strand:+ start:164 stop:547 length:384 start_codon:yes stop_codon:yes gene_type:complete